MATDTCIKRLWPWGQWCRQLKFLTRGLMDTCQLSFLLSHAGIAMAFTIFVKDKDKECVHYRNIIDKCEYHV